MRPPSAFPALVGHLQQGAPMAHIDPVAAAQAVASASDRLAEVGQWELAATPLEQLVTQYPEVLCQMIPRGNRCRQDLAVARAYQNAVHAALNLDDTVKTFLAAKPPHGGFMLRRTTQPAEQPREDGAALPLVGPSPAPAVAQDVPRSAPAPSGPRAAHSFALVPVAPAVADLAEGNRPLADFWKKLNDSAAAHHLTLFLAPAISLVMRFKGPVYRAAQLVPVVLLMSACFYLIMLVGYAVAHPEVLVDAVLAAANAVPQYLAYAGPRMSARLQERLGEAWASLLHTAPQTPDQPQSSSAPWWLISLPVVSIGLGWFGRA